MSVMPRWCCSITALALVVSAVTVGASSTATAKTYRWDCLFNLRASPQGLFKDDFRLEFAYDDVARKAVLIGNQGVADVEIHMGPGSITFLERLVGGVVQTTTVAKDGTSIHSRHTIIGTEMVPSQYYGQCKGQQ